MDDSPATRRSLIVKLQDPADSAAWGQFVAIYEPLVYRLARRKGLQDADARVLCQEVFQAVSRAIDRWEPGRGSFRGWLSRIARNLLINFLTRRQHIPRGTGATSMLDLLAAQPAVDPSATAFFEAEYQRRLFRWAASEIRGEFAPGTWQAFWQTAVLDRNPSDVAAELGLSVGAVYVARSRVLSRLKRRIEECSENYVAIHDELDHEDPESPL
jgi:RNA polymerase sigma-70 factor (ECF subfamily)